LKHVLWNYWWPGMRHTIRSYVRNCDTCYGFKPIRRVPYGHLRPLQVPQRRWQSIFRDFITSLSVSNGFDSFLVVVNC
jgi:hypothetical protein